MEERVLKKVTEEFNSLRFPECRARIVENREDHLRIEFEGTSGGISCCFDEHFVDFAYYLEDKTGKPFIVEEVVERGRGRFLVTFKPKGGSAMEDKKAKVLDAMKKAGKPLRPGDIAKLTGIDKDEVSKLIKELREEGKVFSPKRCYYAPQT